MSTKIDSARSFAEQEQVRNEERKSAGDIADRKRWMLVLVLLAATFIGAALFLFLHSYF
jgi:hypothetical protein